MPIVTAPSIIATIDNNERTSAYVSGTLTDETGAAVPLSSVTAFTVTITDERAGTVINTKSATNILNTNGGTFAATSGAWTYTFASLDSPIVNSDTPLNARESHLALFVVTWGSTGRWNAFVKLRTKNLGGVP